jgi:hypothetical protein
MKVEVQVPKKDDIFQGKKHNSLATKEKTDLSGKYA